MILTILLVAVLICPLPGAVAGEKTAGAVLRYEGRPLRLPINCSRQELASFGMACPPDDPCPLYLELTSVESVKEKIYLTGNLHTTSATLYSVLLASDDGGLSWREPFERVREAGLDRVVFFDAKHGWASGHIMGAEPRDPFFLLTTDGGKFWRRRPVLSTPGAGLIEKFRFDSPTTGSVLIDRLHANAAGVRYEHYETRTGAESWMIREISSTPIHLRGTLEPRQRPDWRLRADHETGAWRLENRDGDTWRLVTEFAIEAGLCVVEEEKAEAAPPPPPKPAAPKELPVAPGGVFRIPGPEHPRKPKTPDNPLPGDLPPPRVHRPR